MQEQMTGLETGLKEYLVQHNPELVDVLPAATYDEVFVGPWATTRELELRHRGIIKSVGETLRGDNSST